MITVIDIAVSADADGGRPYQKRLGPRETGTRV